MLTKTFFAATVLAVLPAVSFALCTPVQQQAQSCATGMVWDSQTHSCVEQVNS